MMASARRRVGRWAGVGIVGAALATTLSARAETAQEVSAAERQALPVAFLSPKPVLSSVGKARVLQALDSEIRRWTLFQPIPIDPPNEICEGRISCVVPEVSRLAILKDAFAQTALVMGLSIGSSGHGTELLTPLLWDQRIAQRSLGAAQRDGLGTFAAEEAIVQAAVVWRGPAIDLRSRADVDEWAAAVVRALEPLLTERGAWRPFGMIMVRNSAREVVVDLDGRTMGLSPGRDLLITDVRTGTRVVRLSGSGFEPIEARVVVESGAVAQVTAEIGLKPRAYPATRIAVDALGGASLIAAASIAMWSAGHQASRDAFCGSNAACLDRPATFNTEASGLLVLPVALGLTSFGGSTLATDLLISDDAPLSRLVPLGVGLLVGAITLTLTTVAITGH